MLIILLDIVKNVFPPVIMGLFALTGIVYAFDGNMGLAGYGICAALLNMFVFYF